MKKINLLAALVAGVFAVACNGGSSSGGSSTPDPTPTVIPSPTPTITPTPIPSPIAPTSCLPADGCNYVQSNGQWESIATTSLSVTGAGQNISFTSGESFITIAMPVLNSSNKSLTTTTAVSSRPVNDVCNPPNQNHNFVIVNGTCQLLPDGQNYAVVTIPGDAYLKGNYSVYTTINGSWSSFNSYTNPNWTILPNNATPPIRLSNESAMYYDGTNSFYNTSLINHENSTDSLPDGINMSYLGFNSFGINYGEVNARVTGEWIVQMFSNATTLCKNDGEGYGIYCSSLSGLLPSGVTPVSSSDSMIVGNDGYIYAHCDDGSLSKLAALGNGNLAIANITLKDWVFYDVFSVYSANDYYTIIQSNNAILQIKVHKERPSNVVVSDLCSLYK